MTRYVAFLRGINVGGHKQVSMAKLKSVFESLGFRNVKTILASGNVLFDAEARSPVPLAGKISNGLIEGLKTEIDVIIRSIEEIHKLVDENPFRKIKVSPQTRLYVTFLSEAPKRKTEIPFESPKEDFRILRLSEREVCSAITRSPEGKTVDLMATIEKEFGRKVTTRNWNTILKILAAAE